MIPVSWDDIPYSKGIKVHDIETIRDKILYVTGISKRKLNQLSITSADKLFTILSFLEDLSVFNRADEESYKDFDFGSQTYEVVEKCKQLLGNPNKTGFEVIPDVIKLITGDDIRQLPLPKAIGIVNFFLLKSIHFFSITKNFQNTNTMQKKFKQELTDSNGSEPLVL